MELRRMTRVFIFGVGYSALHFARTFHDKFQFAGTTTSQEKVADLAQEGVGGFVFSPEAADPAIAREIAASDALLVSVPPDAAGDPVLARYRAAIDAATRLRRIVYLSTLGVYGDCGGAWIDEATPCRPVNARSRARLAAETRWRALEAPGRAVDILRLAGIYGPGRNALVQVKRGTARRIVKPGQVFNRIHAADIAAAIAACLTRDGAGGVFNVCDDEPAPAQDVIAEAARLIGVAAPPEIALEEAQLSVLARSFYEECKRASNRALKETLGVRLAFPTYREGLRVLWAAGEGR
jgi:nucleoside-diphosphate-sugar epimerase